MRFEILGPLRVSTAGAAEPVPVSAQRLRVMLAVLLWRANQPVPVDELSEMVWDGAPPAGAAAAMRTLVLRLRRTLGPQAGARIVTLAPGYLIELAEDELDASRFIALSRHIDAAVRVGDWAAASATAAQAMALWRGTRAGRRALPGTARGLAAAAWTSTRLRVLEWHTEAELHPGAP